MNMQSALALIQNISLLLAASLVFDVVFVRGQSRKKLAAQILSGLSLGAIGMAVMTTPWTLAPGVVFDTRSVLLGNAGLFFGTLPTLIAVAMTSALRVHQGGLGAFTGVCVIVASGLIGLVWRRVRKNALGRLGMGELYLFGIAVHVVMLALMLTLPWETAMRVLAAISVSVMAIYPLGTALMGCLLANRLRHEDASQALRENRRLLAELVENSGNLIVIKDLGGRYKLINRKWEEATGLGRDEILGRTDAQIFPPAMATQYRENDLRVIESATAEEIEETLTDASGTRYYISIKFPLTNERGEVTGLCGVITDITGRKRAEEALRDSETRLSLAMAATNDGLWDWDLTTNKAYFSPRYYTMLGYQSGEFYGSYESWASLIHPEDRVAAEESIRHHIEELTPFEVEFRMLTKSGQWKWILGRGQVVDVDEHGRARRMLGTHVDLSERKQFEQALLLAKDAAEVANRAKSEFLANMSHEIRTPLNGILGMLQLLKTTRLDAEQAEFSDLAIHSTQRLTRLLSDILDLSRVEAGKMQILAEPFDLREAVLTVLDLMRPPGESESVGLYTHVDPAVPTLVVGDAVRVQQILINLVGNALKFTTAGSVSVEAYSLPTHREGQVRILFSVTDTGCGIPDEALEKLFTPFTQVSQGETRTHQGAGLGLSICKRLVQLMGGSIAVESEVGVGTTFCFCVTFGRADAAIVFGDREKPKGFVRGRATVRVLLVDDDEMSRVAGRELLRKAGYLVSTASDGREALQQLAGEGFDLVLMDIQMPVMDGIEATRAIRFAPELIHAATIPIIAMTAYAMSGDREKFLAAGMDDYIAKPVSIQELRKVMERVLGPSTGTRPL